MSPRNLSVDMLGAALRYAQSGLPVIPLHGVNKAGECTCGLARCHSPGKHPRTPNGLKDATTDEAIIRKWWGPNKWPNASIGGVGGDFFCLDIDAKSGGHSSLAKLIEANTPLPQTAVVETGFWAGSREQGDTQSDSQNDESEPARGLHYWFRVPDSHPAPTSRAGIRPGIDIRCTGGYAVLPPSPHASGVRYEWVTDLDEVTEAPEWLLDLVPEAVDSESHWAPDPSHRMSKEVKRFLVGEYTPEPGEQREFLTRAARSVLTTGKSIALAAELLWEGESGEGGIQACEWGTDPWLPEQVFQLVDDIYRKPPTSPMEKDFNEKTFTFDDLGNAERLIASFKEGEIYFCPEFDTWLIWDRNQKRFVKEGDPFLRARHGYIMEQMLEEAMNSSNEERARALYKWATKSRMKHRVDAAVNMAKDLVLISESRLDAQPELFACENGVIDLRTGELRDATPSDLLSKTGGPRFDPESLRGDVRSSDWDGFLQKSIPDEETRRFLQLAAGYSLTGSTIEHKFFYLYGRPATGKSTFVSAFMQVLGEYARVADTSTFTRSSSGRGAGAASEDLARLAGARLVVTQEVEEGERFASALVSQYTGGDPVSARFLHGSTFEFRPKFKLWIAANHRAKVSGSRSGIWRRMMVIPMDEVVPVSERDPALAMKLREPEAQSAILAWAVEGAVAWINGEDLLPPKEVEEEGQAYQSDSDHVLTFVEEWVSRTEDDQDRVPKRTMFEMYLAWCDAEGRERRMTKHQFSRRLTDMELESKNAQYNGTVQACWIGVTVKEPSISVKGS